MILNRGPLQKFFYMGPTDGECSLAPLQLELHVQQQGLHLWQCNNQTMVDLVQEAKQSQSRHNAHNRHDVVKDL